MKRGIVRSLGIGLLTVLIDLIAQACAIETLCPQHRAWERVHEGRSDLVLDDGDRVARPTDAIFTCETPHVTGPIVWHTDLGCYCAPATATAETVAVLVGGRCVLDKAHPTPADSTGACRHAHCADFNTP